MSNALFMEREGRGFVRGLLRGEALTVHSCRCGFRLALRSVFAKTNRCCRLIQRRKCLTKWNCLPPEEVRGARRQDLP